MKYSGVSLILAIQLFIADLLPIVGLLFGSRILSILTRHIRSQICTETPRVGADWDETTKTHRMTIIASSSRTEWSHLIHAHRHWAVLGVLLAETLARRHAHLDLLVLAEFQQQNRLLVLDQHGLHEFGFALRTDTMGGMWSHSEEVVEKLDFSHAYRGKTVNYCWDSTPRLFVRMGYTKHCCLFGAVISTALLRALT